MILKWKTKKVRVFELKYEVFTEISAIMSTKCTSLSNKNQFPLKKKIEAPKQEKISPFKIIFP